MNFMNVDYSTRIPNNVGLTEDARVLKALETWHPGYLSWWQDMGPEGFQQSLVYLRTAQGNDALAWMGEDGKPVTQSQLTILKAAACAADTPALPRTENHHALTQQGMAHIAEEEKTSGGALGRPSGGRFKTYERIKRWRERQGNTRDLFITDEHIRRIDKALEDIYRYPLYQSATDTLNRQLKAGISDADLIDLVFNLREDGRLCLVDEQDQQREPRLICSLGLA